MPSKSKQTEMRHRAHQQKRRVKYKKIFNRYNRHSADTYMNFDLLLVDLLDMHPKCLQTLLNDLDKAYIAPWSGEYNKKLKQAIEFNLLERTMLK